MTAIAEPPVADPPRPAEPPGDGPPSRRRQSRNAAPTPASTPQVAVWALVAVAFLCVWVVLFASLLSTVEEHHDQHNLHSKLRAGLATAATPIGGSIRPGTPVALLNSASGGVDNEVVVEGTTSGELESGPGHEIGSPLPGQAGVSFLFGRSATFGAPFRHLGSLKHGANLLVTTGQGTFTYTVLDTRRAGQAVPAGVEADPNRLTLATASRSDSLGLPTSSSVTYVDLLLNGNPMPAPAGPSTAPANSGPMQSDSGGVYPLVLWLELLLLCGAGGGYLAARSRVSAAQGWIVLTPLGIAALWGASDAAARLLPNLF